MTEVARAYEFKLDVSLVDLRAKLAALGHGPWIERESTWYGDYISGQLWGRAMRIFDGKGTVSEIGTYAPDGFMLLDYARGEHGKPLDRQHHARILEELFPSLGIVTWRAGTSND